MMAVVLWMLRAAMRVSWSRGRGAGLTSADCAPVHILHMAVESCVRNEPRSSYYCGTVFGTTVRFLYRRFEEFCFHSLILNKIMHFDTDLYKLWWVLALPLFIDIGDNILSLHRPTIIICKSIPASQIRCRPCLYCAT